MASPRPGDDPTAVFGRRVVAALLDAALILVPAFLVLSSRFEYLDVASLDRPPAQFCDDYLARVGGMCLNLGDVNERVYFSGDLGRSASGVYWGGTFLLLVVIQGLTGRTFGKLLTGIRTVGEDGRPPGVVKALVRWILWLVDGFPYVVPLLGFIVGLTTVGHRRVGDMVAKTLVVRATAAGSPIVVPGLSEPPVASTIATVPTVMAGTDGPQWDAARNTYIQWDATQSRWFQWDDGLRSWTIIPGQEPLS